MIAFGDRFYWLTRRLGWENNTHLAVHLEVGKNDVQRFLNLIFPPSGPVVRKLAAGLGVSTAVLLEGVRTFNQDRPNDDQLSELIERDRLAKKEGGVRPPAQAGKARGRRVGRAAHGTGYTDTTAELDKPNNRGRRSTDRVVLLTKGTGFPTLRVDRHWRCVMASDAFVRLAGVTLAMLIGMSVWQAVPQLRDSGAATLMRRCMRTRRPQSGRVGSALQPGATAVVTVAPLACGGVEVVGSFPASATDKRVSVVAACVSKE